MEACCGAHHLGRLLVKQGHEVRLMSPEYVGWRGLRVVEARWPDSRPASGNLWHTNGARRRELYEDRDARISILARAEP